MAIVGVQTTIVSSIYAHPRNGHSQLGIGKAARKKVGYAPQRALNSRDLARIVKQEILVGPEHLCRRASPDGVPDLEPAAAVGRAGNGDPDLSTTTGPKRPSRRTALLKNHVAFHG